MSNTQKPAIYVPKCSAKARQVSFGEVLRLSFKVEDLIPFLEEHVNAKGYINLDIAPRKSGPSEYGDTHTVKLDTWEPSQRSEPAQAVRKTAAPVKAKAAAPKNEPTTEETDDVPF